VTSYKNPKKKKSILKLKKPGFAKLKLLEDVPQKAYKTNLSPFHSREPLYSRKFCIIVSIRVRQRQEYLNNWNLRKLYTWTSGGS
jgi:hypothetical protein